MKYLLFFIGIAVIFNSIYLGFLYGIYKPTKNRFISLECNQFNNTHSVAQLQCRKILFNKVLNGECVFDKQNNIILKSGTDFSIFLIFLGSLAALSIAIFIGHVINRSVFNFKS